MTRANRQFLHAGLRSFLFAPGNHPRKVQKVFDTGADAVILDLEDAVASSEKVATREMVVDAMRQPRRCQGYIRVNSVDSEFHASDIEAVVGPWVDGIVLPKAESADQLVAVADAIGRRERALGLPSGSVDLMPIIETALGVERSEQLATASDRVKRLAFGAGDYTLDLDYHWTPDEQVLSYARAKIGHASRIAQIEPPIDTVVIQINDDDRFQASAARGRAFGFAGKLCIHPRQVPLANHAFTPSPQEVEHAKAVVVAFEQAEASGSASIQLDGYFIDYPIVYKAQRTLALMERLSDD